MENAISSDSAKKFTLSCSRCRVSKLKCDRKEPCMECVRRQVGHLCTKVELQPRAKRVKTHHKNQSTGGQPHPSKDLGVEETAQILEKFVEASPFTTDQSLVAPDVLNWYWATPDQQRQNQKQTLIQDVIHTLPDWDVLDALYQVFVMRCQPALGNVVHTSSFMKQAGQLRDCLRAVSPEIDIASTISMDSLACLLLALVLGLAFHPNPSIIGWGCSFVTSRVEQLRTSKETAATWRSLAIRCLQGNITLFCGSIPSLQAAIMLLLDNHESSLELDSVLASAISGARKLGFHRLGNATLNVSLLSDDALSAGTEPDHIRTEIGIRIWWALVMRDWSRGQDLGCYSIHPSHFNTRFPLHINDDDLLSPQGIILERPRSEFTMLSYTLHALELTSIVRETIDFESFTVEAAQRRQNLNQKYESYVANMPSYFRLGSTTGLTALNGPMAAIPVQRFMLFQQLWSFLLRLHRVTVSSPMGHASCSLLAQNIISTQYQVEARCVVCNSLSTNNMQLFNAALVLLLGLLFYHPKINPDDPSVQLNRLMTKDKIREAIKLLSSKTVAKRSTNNCVTQGMAQDLSMRAVSALEALMKLEEEQSQGSLYSKGEIGVDSDQNHSRVHQQIVDTLKSLSTPTNSAEATDSRTPSFNPEGTLSDLFLPPTDEIFNMSVLPVLSSAPSPSMWEFLDFPRQVDGAP